MSHAFYSSGDRDEDGNYLIPKVWSDSFDFKPSTSKLEQCKVDLMQVDFDFIEKKIDTENRSEKFRWIRVSQYAHAVKNFYWSAISMFYKTFCNKEVSNSPIGKITMASLFACAQKLKQTENTIIQQTYLHDKHSLESFINRYAKVKKITEYGNLAWLMYDSLVDEMKKQRIIENSVGITKVITNSVAYKNAIDEVDEKDYVQLLKLFRNAKLVQRQIQLNLKPNYVAVQHGVDFYKDYNSLTECDKLIEIVGGVKISNMDQTLIDIKGKLDVFFEQRPVIARIVKFYETYYKMKSNVNTLYKLADNYVGNKGAYNINPFEDDKGVKYYPLVLSYQSACKSLIEQLQGEDKMFTYDVQAFLEYIEKCINYVKEPYTRWKEEDDRLTAEALKRYPFNKND